MNEDPELKEAIKGMNHHKGIRASKEKKSMDEHGFTL